MFCNLFLALYDGATQLALNQTAYALFHLSGSLFVVQFGLVASLLPLHCLSSQYTSFHGFQLPHPLQYFFVPSYLFANVHAFEQYVGFLVNLPHFRHSVIFPLRQHVPLDFPVCIRQGKSSKPPFSCSCHCKASKDLAWDCLI